MSGESSLIVRFGADTAGLDSAVAVAKATLQGYNAELRKLAKEAAASGGAVNDNLAKSLREASAGAAGMQRELKALTAKPIIEVESAAKNFNKQLDNIAAFAWNNTSLSGNQIERVVNPLKGMTTAIGVVPTVALAAGAAIAALAAVTGNYAQGELAKLGDIVKQTGVSANSIQGAKVVGAGAGVGSDAMVEAIKNASKQFQQFSRNSGEVKDNLEKVDEAFLKVADKAKSSGEFIDIVGQKIRELPREEGIDLAKALFGDDTGEKLYEPIILGQLEMRKLGQDAQAAGVALDDGVVKAAREAQIQIDEAEAKTSGKLLHAFQSLAPPVAALKVEFFHVVDAIADATGGAAKFVGQLHEAAADARAIAQEKSGHQTGGVPFKEAFANYLKPGVVLGNEVQGPPSPGSQGAGVSRARYAARDADDDKAKKAKSPKGNSDALNEARKEIDGEIQAVQQQTEINKAQYELDFANKKITEEEKNSLVKQADEQQFEATKSLYEREAAIAGQKPQQRQQINNKIETLESQHQVKMLELATKEIEDASKFAREGAQQLAGTLTSSLSQALIGAVEHTKTKDAGRKIAQSLFSDLVNEFAKNTLTSPLEKALEPGFKAMGDMITKPLQNALGGIASGLSGALGATAGGATSAVAAGAAGSGAGAVELSTSALSLTTSATELTAAAAALSSAAAALGAGGATAGAGGAAAAGGGGLLAGFGGLLKSVLPGFDVGSWQVPSLGNFDGKGGFPALVHPGEMIIPAGPAGALRQAAPSGGARGGGNTTNVHAPTNVSITAMDSRSVTRAFQQNDRALIKTIGRAAQRGAHLGVKGLMT